MEDKLVERMRVFLYEHKATVVEGVLEEIAEECIERWELDTEAEVNALRFEYFSEEEADEDGDCEAPEIWVYNGFRDISFDLTNGESTGSGGGVL